MTLLSVCYSSIRTFLSMLCERLSLCEEDLVTHRNFLLISPARQKQESFKIRLLLLHNTTTYPSGLSYPAWRRTFAWTRGSQPKTGFRRLPAASSLVWCVSARSWIRPGWCCPPGPSWHLQGQLKCSRRVGFRTYYITKRTVARASSCARSGGMSPVAVRAT